MKKLIGFVLMAILVIGMSACSSYGSYHRHGRIPPGKAKKIYGDKSAKRYAPGQQKKRWKNSKKYKGNKNKGRDRKYDTTTYPWK
ncbi:hypothetical protein [Sphingobacterium shayense]|uniref:hypothetical protein n=1 Tax=Sphingobacterium shayense TaxID=626343 RepID=UPI001C130D43|nr:hypothetical protein [Sphingobacterium shayense]